jgi:hypothetical protein
MTKGLFVIFDTDFTATIKRADINDGKVMIKDKDGTEKEFIVDKANPFIVSSTMQGTRPMYLLKWNSLTPVKWVVKENNQTFTSATGEEIHAVVRDLEVVNPQFDEKGKITPDILRQTHDSRFLRAMKKYATGEKQGFGGGASVFIFLVIGMFVMYFLIASKVIPIA